MYINDEEYRLLKEITPELNERLGSIVVYIFTASSIRGGDWVARIDYTGEGEDPDKDMKGLLLQGNGPNVNNYGPIAVRKVLTRPSIARLREGLLELELESPDAGERED